MFNETTGGVQGGAAPPCQNVFGRKLSQKDVFGRKIARRRKYGARTGRSILKRPGFPRRVRSARPENGRKVEHGRNMLGFSETQKIESLGGPKLGLQSSVRHEKMRIGRVRCEDLESRVHSA